MSTRRALGLGVVCTACLVLPAGVQADWWDSFDDGSYLKTPPGPWDPCDPNWLMYRFAGLVFLEDANDGWLRLYVQNDPFAGYGALIGIVDDEDWDANTSTTWFDDTAPHYYLAQMKIGIPNYDPNYWIDPNDPNTHDANYPGNGEACIFMHLQPATWWFYCGDLMAYDASFNISLGNGPEWFTRGWHVRWDLDDANGFWMLVEWDGDGDPNHSYIRGAAWNGDKYDWDGFWDVDLHVLSAWDPNEQNYDYIASGVCGAGCIKSEWSGPNEFTDVKFDNFEARWGRFGEQFPPATLTLKLVDANRVNVEPNLPLYPKGMVIVLETVCQGSKKFKKWTIKGPNDASDPLYQVINDTNDILYLTMAGDYWVKAVCKCGGGGIEPFAAMALLVLGLTVVIRRVT